MGYTFVESDLGEVLTYLSRFDTYSFDLETTGLNPHDSRVLLAQVGFPDNTQFVIDVAKVDIRPLLPSLSSRRWKKIYFNGKFDEQFMIKYYDTPILNVFDCFIAERVIAPEAKWDNSFEALALKYLEVTLNKEVRKSFYGKKGAFSEAQIQYAADDVKYLFPLVEAQTELLAKRELSHVADLEFDLVTVISNMELTGVPIVPSEWRKIYDEYAAEHRDTGKKVLTELLGVTTFDEQMGFLDDGPIVPHDSKGINLGSPDQVKRAFKDKLGIILEDTKDQTISNINHPAAFALTEYRALDKIMTSYGKSFLDKVHPFTGRIHANWQQIGTETGRFSCSQPNLQQVPEKFRACIGGEDDYVLVGADFSQMELRILAQESKDPILVDAFTTGKDIHAVTATTMFGVDIDQVTKEQRFAAKTLNFGITYGMKPKKFVDMINGEARKTGAKSINMRQGKEMMEKYKETYRAANRYLENLGNLSIRTGMTQTPFGRKRYFTPVSTDLDPRAYQGQIEAIKRQGANMPIQGTNADITKMAMITLHDDFRDYGYRASIILQVHDEIVVLAHKSQAEALKPIITNAMIEAGKDLMPDIPIVADAYVSRYWKK